MKQTICDNCGKIGGFATLRYTKMYGWIATPVTRDVCKKCVNTGLPNIET